jgi:hypothetical protein
MLGKNCVVSRVISLGCSMPSTHYYDRKAGAVIKRPPPNPEHKAGSASGRKQRQKDQLRGVYPRSGLPISREDRSDCWIRAYQSAYYQTTSLGNPNLGDRAETTISLSVDRELLEAIDSAGISRSSVFTAGAQLLLTRNKQAVASPPSSS